jgi:hypothetical protein
MSQFNPSSLSVEFRGGASGYAPVEGRKYTLTHSDDTAELFLTIGSEFAWDKVNETRDEVFAQWTHCPEGRYILQVYLYVYGPDVSGNPEIRNSIFRRELPLALEAMCYGDREFITLHPQMRYSNVMVHFYSTLPQYSRIEPWGNFGAYCV